MLAFNVAALLKAPPGTTRDLTIDEPRPGFAADLGTTGPVRGTARLFRTQAGIVVRADLETAVVLECSRCLEPVQVPITAHLEEEYLPSINIVTGAPLELADDEALRIDEHHTLDLTEAARQYLVTAVPIGVRCAPDCRGLCPQCGANLNDGPCACGAEPTTNPFGVLAAILCPEPPPVERR